ncbi:MAG: hypothetical protein KME60_23565 [Cyanomargarita calcarea GSE-NOS-MK-12-04C]|jgi:hypothetical protein|uniref:Uncharacterized protein n=1 Tax=Cyanomargarita calcarea GSE-NOS-MK-12-04C TaxID=2839659 RepID=A0A951QPV1_9CYAN|nr:hypothetical protein [Cyanomargarita calcarea GSE-NOS-MK-12-04C]
MMDNLKANQDKSTVEQISNQAENVQSSQDITKIESPLNIFMATKGSHDLSPKRSAPRGSHDPSPKGINPRGSHDPSPKGKGNSSGNQKRPSAPKGSDNPSAKG